MMKKGGRAVKIHYTHANFRVPPAQKLDRPQGFASSDKFYPIFFHFHAPAILTFNMQEENINLTAREEDVRPMTYHED